MGKKAKGKTSRSRKLPAGFLKFQKTYPKTFAAYDPLGAAAYAAGPLEPKVRALIKLAIAVGARTEGGVRTLTRQALRAKCTAEDIRHVVLLATTIVGFPDMISVWAWVDEVLYRKG